MINKKYDVVIIGAGIGGLVCACYLAMKKIRTAVFEQHTSAGGYCTSFWRKGYYFDAGIHTISAINNGVLGSIIRELDLDVNFKRFDPTDKIIMPDNVTLLWTDVRKTINEFSKSFPKERKNIKDFFHFLSTTSFYRLFSLYKNKKCIDALNDFFTDNRIKETIGVLLGNIGVSIHSAAAVPALLFLKEYLFDSGYYPEGGMQGLANALVRRFTSLGGELYLSQKVISIITDKDKRVQGIKLEKGYSIKSKIVVSNCDAYRTYTDLLESKTQEARKLKHLVFSPSMFIVYLGLKGNYKEILNSPSNVWYFSSYDTEDIFSHPNRSLLGKQPKALLFVSPVSHHKTPSSGPTALICTLAEYKTKNFWDKRRQEVAQKLIKRVENIYPSFSNCIAYIETATPHTLERYTSNKNGSFIGWLNIPSPTNTTLLPQKSSVHGLFLVGHWTTPGITGIGGIPNVAFSGKKGAQMIVKDFF